jgi:glucokinase
VEGKQLTGKGYIGIDLGGTNIKIGLVDRNGDLIHESEGPTHAEEGSEAVLQRMSHMAQEIANVNGFSWNDIVGVGVGIPGFMNMTEGVVRMAPNLKWENVPAKERLSHFLQKPVFIENDANVAALGEAWRGAGEGISHVVCVTLGTGVGGGIIIDGLIYQGYQGMAGEIGHIPMVVGEDAHKCGCGIMGCLETVSSATGIARLAQKKVQNGKKSSLSSLQRITAKDVFLAAQAGDVLALSVVHEAATVLGRALGGLAVTLNPGRFVIGGGVSKAGELLFDPIRKAFAASAPKMLVDTTDIVAAQLGNRAGVVGAAGLVAKSITV